MIKLSAVLIAITTIASATAVDAQQTTTATLLPPAPENLVSDEDEVAEIVLQLQHEHEYERFLEGTSSSTTTPMVLPSTNAEGDGEDDVKEEEATRPPPPTAIPPGVVTIFTDNNVTATEKPPPARPPATAMPGGDVSITSTANNVTATANNVTTTSNATGFGEVFNVTATPTAPPTPAATANATVTDPSYSAPGVYNTRTTSCPGYDNVQGYTTLSSLQQDLETYFHSLTYSPTLSQVPTPAPSGSPTETPTDGPSKHPTASPSEIPTKAPITNRPSPNPTSSIRGKVQPTISPAPTIKIKVVGGGGGGGPTGPTGPTRRLDMGMPPAPSPTFTLISELLFGSSPSTRRKLEGPPSPTPTRMGSSGTRKRMRGHEDVDNMMMLGSGIDWDAVDFFTETISPAQSPYEFSSSASQARSHIDTHLIDDGDSVAFNICPNTTFDFTNETAVDEILLSAGITNATLSYNDTSRALSNDTSWAFDPITLETPLRNPIAIRCIQDSINSTCTFTGGTVHVLIDNNAWFINQDTDYQENINGTLDDHDISISGITFTQATQSSILMNDPRSAVTFGNCKWQGNTGHSVMHINGTYVVPVEEVTTTSSTLDMSIFGTSESTKFGRMLYGDDDDTRDDDTIVTGKGEYYEPSMDGDDVREELVGDDVVVVGEEEEEMIRGRTTTTTSTEAAFDWGSLGFRYDHEEEVEEPEESLLSSSFVVEQVVGKEQNIERVLDGEAEDEPRSVISVDKCTFSGNTGSATIMISSNSNDNGRDNGQTKVHSIHMRMKETTFAFEDVQQSVILNSGGKLQSTFCLFENNTATSIIKSQKGTMEVSRTKFAGNEVSGDGGMVELDAESELEENESNCANDVNNDVVLDINAARYLAQVCDGVLSSDGLCEPFDTSCLQRDNPAEPTASPTMVPTRQPVIPSRPNTPTRKPSGDSSAGTGGSKPSRPNRPTRKPSGGSSVGTGGNKPNRPRPTRKPSGGGSGSTGDSKPNRPRPTRKPSGGGSGSTGGSKPGKPNKKPSGGSSGVTGGSKPNRPTRKPKPNGGSRPGGANRPGKPTRKPSKGGSDGSDSGNTDGEVYPSEELPCKDGRYTGDGPRKKWRKICKKYEKEKEAGSTNSNNNNNNNNEPKGEKEPKREPNVRPSNSRPNRLPSNPRPARGVSPSGKSGKARRR